MGTIPGLGPGGPCLKEKVRKEGEETSVHGSKALEL